MTIDLDSTIVEVHGDKKQGAAYGYTKVLGYHPLLATRASTGEVLHARLRKGYAYDDPNIALDVYMTSAYWGLPLCGAGCFTKVDQNGGTTSRHRLRRGGRSRPPSMSNGRTPWPPVPTSCWSRPMEPTGRTSLPPRGTRARMLATS